VTLKDSPHYFQYLNFCDCVACRELDAYLRDEACPIGRPIEGGSVSAPLNDLDACPGHGSSRDIPF